MAHAAAYALAGHLSGPYGGCVSWRVYWTYCAYRILRHTQTGNDFATNVCIPMRDEIPFCSMYFCPGPQLQRTLQRQGSFLSLGVHMRDRERSVLGLHLLKNWVRLENFQGNRFSSRIRLIHSSSVSGLHSSPKKLGDYFSSLPSTIETNDRAPGPVVLYSPPLSCVALRILRRHQSQL